MSSKPSSPIHRWLSTGSISLDHQDYRKSTYLTSENDIEDKLCTNPCDESNDVQALSDINYTNDNIESYENLIYKADYQSSDTQNGIIPKESQKTFSDKYARSLRHLYPFRKKPKRNTLPGNDAGLFSFISTSWMTGFMWKTYRSGKIETNKWKLHAEDECEVNVTRLEKIWYNEVKAKGKKDCSFFKCILKFGQTRFIVTTILIMIAAVCQFLGPGYFLMLIVAYVEETYESDENQLGRGFLSVFYLLLVLLLRLFTFSCCWVLGIHMGCRLEGAIQAMLFKKALCLQGGEKLATQIITLSTNDMERIFEAVCAWPLIFMTPVMFLMSLIYGYYVLGPWALLGMTVILLSYPVMGVIAALGMKLRHKTILYTDKRVSLTNEVLNNIKLIKMYGWESSFVTILKGIRKQEHNSLIKAAMLLSLNSAISPSITPLATIVTFIAHTLSGNGLTASEAFTIYSVFASLQFSVTSLPYTLRCIGESIVCFRRIQSLMLTPSAYNSLPKTTSAFDIELEGASFGVDSELENAFKDKNISRKGTEANLLNPEKPDKLTDILFDLNLRVPKGLLLGVCGEVGSGKSSLLSALCGSMKLQAGHAALTGSIAYVSQIAWIFNGTLRNNILFGEEWHQEWYSTVLESCCLYADLEMLPTGDMTELGDKGVNLSGGQKQRISLARALYSRKDIYLLDDPLSALDSQVAQLVFENYVKGVLSDKTVVLVTHNIQFLERCNEIIVMKNGSIVEQGSHSSLLDLKGEYSHFIKFDTKRENVDELTRVNTSDDLNVGTNEDMCLTGELYDNEDMGKGEVSFAVYHQYLKAAQGTCFSIFVFFLIIASSATKLFDGIWLQHWIDSGDGLEEERLKNMTMYNTTTPMYKELKGYVNEHPKLWFFQTVYVLCFVMILLVGIIKGFSLVRLFLLSSTHLHNQMLLRVLHCPTSFFDTNPIGRILNRFSKDMDEIDVRIPFIIDFVSQGICVIIMQMILITVFYPFFIGIVIVIIIIYIVADLFLNVGIRAAKRNDNITKSHLIHQIQSAVQGQTMINIYGKQQFITKQYLKCVNENLLAAIYFRFASRWYAYKLESLALILITGTAVIIVLIKQSPAIAGLALSTVFQICMFSTVLMRLKAELTARFTAAERVLEYAKTLPQEAPFKLDSAKLPDPWPVKGKIEMKKVNMRYRPNMPLVLKDLTVTIEGGQKIGIIGRTGAGKSSLMSVLLRLVEIETGAVLIDDIDISNIGLGDLRKSIAVIPQDPVLFRGSIRYNLDPFDEYDDETIWTVLEKSHLKDTISRADQKLDSQVSPGGSNFSVGERQLICLARALLRKSKVLLLDEATASVDVRTDKLIQNTICETFSNCTVLTIAHRLNTILTYDMIMVLKEGKVLEYGPPQKLMKKEDSLFRAMLLAMGITSL